MITVDIPNIKQIERQLGRYKDQAPDVLSKAINNAAKEARKALANKAKETYTIKVKGITKDLKLKKATKSRLYADLNSKGKVIALSRYKVSPAKPVFGTVGMHKAKNLVENSMKNLIKKFDMSDEKGFVAKMKNGHVGIYVRAPDEFMDKYTNPKRNKVYNGRPIREKM